jgi:hypothetical protein
VINCTKSRALRYEMRKVWNLPDELRFGSSGLDWLPLLLSSLNAETKARVLLLLWHAWGGADTATILGSA